MKVIDQIRQRFDATRISSTTALGVKYLPIDDNDIRELESLQQTLTELSRLRIERERMVKQLKRIRVEIDCAISMEEQP